MKATVTKKKNNDWTGEWVGLEQFEMEKREGDFVGQTIEEQRWYNRQQQKLRTAKIGTVDKTILE